MLVGGLDDEGRPLSNVELFPRPPSDTCFIPDLPSPRAGHTLSLLSGGRLVVCGGRDDSNNFFNTCISWAAGNTSWTPLFTMRCLTIMIKRPQRCRWPRPTAHNQIVIRICCSFSIQYLFNSTKISANNNPLQSPSLSNTITVWKDLPIRPGHPLLFPTPLFCSADILMQQGSVQRFCQVKKRQRQSSIY